MIQLIHQERISDQETEQIIDVAVPEIREHIVEVVRVMPQERLQQRTQGKDPAVLQGAEKTVVDMKAQTLDAQRQKHEVLLSTSQPAAQLARQGARKKKTEEEEKEEEEEEEKEEGDKGEVERKEEEKGVGKRRKKEETERKWDRREKGDTREGERGREKEARGGVKEAVEKDVMDGRSRRSRGPGGVTERTSKGVDRTIQIFVKVEGRTLPVEMSPSDKVGDIVVRVTSGACGETGHVRDVRREGAQEKRRAEELRTLRRKHSADYEQDARWRRSGVEARRRPSRGKDGKRSLSRT